MRIRGIPIKTREEWEGVLEALAQYVDNEMEAADYGEDPYKRNPRLAGAEAVMERMERALFRAVGVD